MYSNLDLDTLICKVMSISGADCSKTDKLNYIYPGGSRPRPVSHNTGRVFYIYEWRMSSTFCV